jgi:hypothetical protein
VTEKTEKPVEEKHESVSENEPAKPKNAPAKEQPHPVAAPVPQSVPISIPPMDKKSKVRPAKGGILVPPPPATPFIIPSFQPPPGVPIQAAPAPAPKPAPKPKPVEHKEAPAKEASEDSDAGGDPEFLIKWGDGNKKKHK